MRGGAAAEQMLKNLMNSVLRYLSSFNASMKVAYWVIGKTSPSYLKEGLSIYEKRLPHYLKFSSHIFPDVKNAKNLKPTELKKREGALVLKKLEKTDFLILLDERGKAFNSVDFANFLDKRFQQSSFPIIFLIGGAFGFSDELYQRANFRLQLSNMTFSHQMVRLFFLEQLYRAMTILKGEPYHNQ